MSNEILDEAALMEECDGEKDLLTHYVEIFDRDCGKRFPKLREAIQQGDSKTVKEEAHALKGGLGCLFANAGFKTAYELETMGASEELSDAEATFRNLQDEVQVLRKRLGELIAS